MIGKNSYKHIKRYREIITVFIKYGFSAIIEQLGILKYLNMKKNEIIRRDNKIVKRSRGERFRLVLEELGTTFIKLGQMLSMRPDVLPKDMRDELEKLHSSVPSFSFESVKLEIESELKENIEDIYMEFKEEPLAAASVGQVHLAKTKDGKTVVVKIRRPEIEKKIEQDIAILKDIAWFFENHTKYKELCDFGEMIREFESILRDELDFRIEGRNAEILKKNLSKNKNIVIPSIDFRYTAESILTMEYIKGIELNDIDTLKKEKIDLEVVARSIATTILEQILRDGFFHGDPHPGNIMIVPDSKIVFLDFGMVGKLREERKIQFLKMLIGIVFGKSKFIIDAIISLDAMVKRSNIRKLKKDIDTFVSKYLELPISEIELGEVFNEIFKLIFKYKIKMPKEFTMLAKTLIITEGVLKKLAPQINVLEIAKPIAKGMFFKVFSARKISGDVIEGIYDYLHLVKDFPDLFLNFLKKMEDEDFTLYFDLKSVDIILKSLNRVSNRIAFSIALLSLSFIIAGLVVGFGIVATAKIDVYVLYLTILKVGLVVSVTMFLVLILSIFKTGRF